MQGSSQSDLQQQKKKFSLDDIGNGERLINSYGNNIRYCPILGKWLIWSGQRWEVDDVGKIHELARRTARSIYSEAKEQEEIEEGTGKKIKLHAYTSCSSSSMKNMIGQASTMANIPVLQSSLDCNEFLINCENGTIDLKNGKLSKHNREHLMTKIAPVKYKKDEKSPLWESFLNKIFDGNVEMIKFLQKAVGYSLTGSIREQCIFITHGIGANGKSTFMDTIQDIMGDYAKNSSMTTFLDKKNDSNTNDIAKLAGCRWVGASEADDGKKLSESLVKQLTGGEKISARFLHKEFFEFLPTFKIWMGTNHKPVIKGTDNGIWRRIMLIPFEITITDEEKDKELTQKLKNEASGIFNWAIEGCLLWQKEGLQPPLIVQNANSNYRSEMDILKGFLLECCVKRENTQLQSSSLYKVYARWADENGEYVLSQMKFSLKMNEKGLKITRKKDGKYWDNIQLTDDGNRLFYGAKGNKNDGSEDKLPWDN